MISSLLGYIHMTISGEFATSEASSSQTTASWDQLYRMVLFYHDFFVSGYKPSNSTVEMHIPDLESNNGMLNMLSLCALVMWCNAFSWETYKNAPDVDHIVQSRFKITGLTAFVRYKFAYMKKVARNLLRWILKNYSTVPANVNGRRSFSEDVFGPFIGNIIVQTGCYVMLDKSTNKACYLNVSSGNSVCQQMLDAFSGFPQVKTYVVQYSTNKAGSILMEFPKTLKISKKSVPVKVICTCF